MTDVQFEEEPELVSQETRVRHGAKGLVKLVMRLGAKNENQATYILIGIMVVCLIATMYIISTYLI